MDGSAQAGNENAAAQVVNCVMQLAEALLKIGQLDAANKQMADTLIAPHAAVARKQARFWSLWARIAVRRNQIEQAKQCFSHAKSYNAQPQDLLQKEWNRLKAMCEQSPPVRAAAAQQATPLYGTPCDIGTPVNEQHRPNCSNVPPLTGMNAYPINTPMPSRTPVPCPRGNAANPMPSPGQSPIPFHNTSEQNIVLTGPKSMASSTSHSAPAEKTTMMSCDSPAMHGGKTQSKGEHVFKVPDLPSRFREGYTGKAPNTRGRGRRTRRQYGTPGATLVRRNSASQIHSARSKTPKSLSADSSPKNLSLEGIIPTGPLRRANSVGHTPRQRHPGPQRCAAPMPASHAGNPMDMSVAMDFPSASPPQFPNGTPRPGVATQRCAPHPDGCATPAGIGGLASAISPSTNLFGTPALVSLQSMPNDRLHLFTGTPRPGSENANPNFILGGGGMNYGQRGNDGFAEPAPRRPANQAPITQFFHSMGPKLCYNGVGKDGFMKPAARRPMSENPPIRPGGIGFEKYRGNIGTNYQVCSAVGLDGKLNRQVQWATLVGAQRRGQEFIYRFQQVANGPIVEFRECEVRFS